MKAPTQISQLLARQWQHPHTRLMRLLNPNSWPKRFAIGKPTARIFSENVQAVQLHVETWRRINIGEVEWEPVTYRAGLAPIALPLRWCLRNPSEWVAATGDPDIGREYARLEHLVEQVDARFHALLVSQRSLWLTKSSEEVINAAQLAIRLSPGCAQGRPLRLLAEHGVDTKFFERNTTLLTRLLDEIFEGVASEQGLTTFLDALEENNHWLLIAPLAAGILPFKHLRLATTELAETVLPGSRLIVVENERCIHQLPLLPDTIAILGAGLDLRWLASAHFADKQIAYWGDIDTWGLLMLGRARQYRPSIQALLMDRDVFDQYAPANAVTEPTKAQDDVPDGLLFDEADLYRHLLLHERGRLEQEYLPKARVEAAVAAWVGRP